MDGEAWWAAVHGVAKSQTTEQLPFHFSRSRIGESLGEGHGNPLQCSRLENPHGQRSLAGYSPWGHKELDMIERLN